MDAMGAADTGCVFEFQGAALQHLLESLEVLEEDFVGLLEEVAVGGVDDIGGGEPVVNPLALGTEAFTDGAGKCNYVMAGDFFDLLDAVHVEGGRGADFLDVLLRDDAQFAPGFAGEDFDFEVRLELVLLGPDGNAGDVFIQFDVAVRDAGDDFGRHFRNLLAGLALETVGHQPFADELLGKLLLVLAAGEALGVSVGIEVAGGVGGVDLVHQDDLPVALAELVFGVHEDEALFGRHLRTPLEQGAGVGFELLIILLGNDALGDDFFLGDVFVMAFGRLGGGGDDGLGELLVLHHALGQRNAAEGALAGLVFAPGMAGQIAADDHFHLEGLAAPADGDHRVGLGDLPVGDDVGGGVQEAGGDLVEDLALERDAFREDDVEGGDAVGGDHHEVVVADEVYVTDFARVFGDLLGEMEIGTD